MRSLSRARWPRSALGVAIIATIAAVAVIAPASIAVATPDAGKPARPAKKKKPVPRTSIATCAHLEQTDGDDGVMLRVVNECEIALSCGVSWRLTCAPDTRGATHHHAGAAFDLAPSLGHATAASATTCGERGWEITAITWSCEPQR